MHLYMAQTRQCGPNARGKSRGGGTVASVAACMCLGGVLG